MVILKLDDFATRGILKEKEFREQIEAHDWRQYDGKVVMIQGCSKLFIPQWAYLIAALRLSRHAKKISRSLA